MNKLVLSLCLIAVGIVVIVMGHRREESVVGLSDAAGANIANAFDGKARQPEHLWYYVGGGALILAGVATALRKKSG
ncbi:MAG: DUF3185 family protein [Opitutaceae bacterium]|nr:DUF3185 family protein [Opitutaceae bacterium]MBP9913000.1 DUF3185 family protein [Opitutaceae bacterium]